MIKQRKIELLAPAKNLECGIEAINHGADAVYIGAPKFGARAAAVNSLEDIEASDTTSCQYADGQSYAGKSEVPLGSRFPSSGVGAGVIVA